MKKHKTKIIWGVVLVGLIGLMYWGGGSSSSATWEDTDVSCLASGHQGLAFHIHSNLAVIIDGQQQPIQANTGISQVCMAEVHTHDASGYVHAESTDHNAVLTLRDFFAVWDEKTEREGYEANVLVNSEGADFDYEFRDGDDVEVVFTSTDASVSDEEVGTTTDDEGNTDEEIGSQAEEEGETEVVEVKAEEQ
jgi:hypothetical protein